MKNELTAAEFLNFSVTTEIYLGILKDGLEVQGLSAGKEKNDFIVFRGYGDKREYEFEMIYDMAPYTILVPRTELKNKVRIGKDFQPIVSPEITYEVIS
ncbi:MAG: hypothetical protein LBU89_00850 [Fibromonadaceae bacterium]|jgi:hypothetical protein|nr:hypothetical protein [Fibromonadaceae bacterium]